MLAVLSLSCVPLSDNFSKIERRHWLIINAYWSLTDLGTRWRNKSIWWRNKMDLMSRSIAINQIPRELYEDNRIRDVHITWSRVIKSIISVCRSLIRLSSYSSLGIWLVAIDRLIKSILFLHQIDLFRHRVPRSVNAYAQFLRSCHLVGHRKEKAQPALMSEEVFFFIIRHHRFE